MNTQRFGVCCECQSVHPVRSARRSGFCDDEVYDCTDSEEFEYVMDAHQPFGERWCDGEGTNPQALIRKTK